MTYAEILSHFPDARKNGSGFKAKCPAHTDSTPSLQISEGSEGKTVVHCHAGCATADILAAVGLSVADLFDGARTVRLKATPKSKKLKGKIVATYDFQDEDGKLLFQEVRYEPKDFRQRRPDGNGGWLWSLNGVRPVLFHLPKLLTTNSNVYVFIVEGPKDVERLEAEGLTATTNPMGAGKWRIEFNESLRGRHVIIIPDNDKPGREHAEQVAHSLNGVAASIKILSLPGLSNKGDVSDWLSEGGTVEQLHELVASCPLWIPSTNDKANQSANLSSESVIEDDTSDCPYKANGRGLIWHKPVSAREGQATTVDVPLTNFLATITADIERDDGTESSRVYEITASLAADRQPRKGTVNAEDFDSLRWLNTILGARAVVYPAKAEHTRVAIRLLSRGIQARRVITHTGWRDDGDGWRYYHAGGAIGAEGLIEAEVELPPQFAPCHLPAPPTGTRLHEVVRAVAFDLPQVAPEALTLVLLGGGFAAVLTEPDFSLFLVGYTGSGKSELAALLQGWFGLSFNAKTLPAAWSSSANALEAIAHTAKDCVLVIDDFCPLGSAQEQARLHAAADRVFRAQGNHSGRARCRTDGSVRPPKPPRGLAVGTGEDLPRGQSLRARLAILQVEKDAVKWEQLTKCQQQAREGFYAEAMSAFLQWLAKDGRISKLRTAVAADIGKLREEWLSSGVNAHKRSATTLAYLQRAWNVWLEFAAESGALDDEEITGIREAVMTALDTLGRAQEGFCASENPATRFVELVQAALASGRAHLAALNGGQPDDREAWGWRGGEAQGDRIGWLDGDNLYLQPDAGFKLAQAMGGNGEGLTITAQTLWKRLKEAGLLASVDEKRDTLKVRRKIGDRSQAVIHMSAKKWGG